MKKRGSYETIRAGLIEMMRVDQEMRNRATETGEWDESVDAHKTERLKAIVAEIGWPRKSDVGFEGAQAAWLLAQHADADVPFQERCLAMMQALPQGEYRAANLAYLEDRVRVNTGRPQLYGTQFFGWGDTFGPRPIEDPEHLDERRLALGMAPHAEYAKLLTDMDRKRKQQS